MHIAQSTYTFPASYNHVKMVGMKWIEIVVEAGNCADHTHGVRSAHTDTWCCDNATPICVCERSRRHAQYANVIFQPTCLQHTHAYRYFIAYRSSGVNRMWRHQTLNGHLTWIQIYRPLWISISNTSSDLSSVLELLQNHIIFEIEKWNKNYRTSQEDTK